MEDDFLLAEIAKLHYIDQMKQKDIAEIFSMTPIQISRLLRTAVEKDIVRFHIKMPVAIDFELGRALRDRYRLRECIVIDEDSEDMIPMRIAQYLSRYVFSLLQEDSVIGLSWGRGIYESVKLFPYSNLSNVKVVQLAGGVFSDNNHLVTPSQIIISACERLRSVPVLLNAPFFTTNTETKNQLLMDQGIQQVYSLARKATVNIIGASPLHRGNTMSKVGIISDGDIEELIAVGAIGDMAGFFIDGDGEPVRWSKSELYTGVPLEMMNDALTTICIAGEKEKEGIIRAGLKKKYFNMLITSRQLAGLLL